MSRSETQGFKIIGADFTKPEENGADIEACCSFQYKGYEISMSTSNYNKGGMLLGVLLLKDGQIIKEFNKSGHLVQDAITYIEDSLLKQ